MSNEVSDLQLRQLLSGQLSAAEEERLENLVSLDVGLRMRLDELSGGDQWSIGSAPLPVAPTSARLSLAMQSVEHFIRSGEFSGQLSPGLKSLNTANAALPAELPKLDGIKCVRLIGQGGMGVVYEGFDETLGRPVAVKLIQPMKAASPEARERLIREAKAAASLQHDNIVTIHSIQSLDSTPALIQQYIDGFSLQELLDKQGQLPIEQCIDLFRQLASGLAAAHAQGIIHRDLKPGNVLIENHTGKARLADFGMARHLADLRLSEAGVVSGTPAFMSPEQTRGQTVDQRSDLFSLGGVIYNCLTGQAPFHADDPFVVMDRVRNMTVPSAKELRPESPDWLASIIRRLMAKEPSQRIQSAGEVLKLLDISSNSRAGLMPLTPGSASPISMPAVLSIGLFSLMAMVAGWLVYQQFAPSSTLPSSNQSLASPPPVQSPKLAITNERTGQTYLDLASAVSEAKSEDTLVVGGDIESNQIDIAAKSLTIRAAPGTRPTISASQWAVKHCPFFIRSDSDLKLEGLNIDWQVESAPPLDSLQSVSGVVALTSFDRQLQLVDCRIFRSDVGICVVGTGSLKLQRTWLSGGFVGVVWVARENPIEAEQCILNCTTQISFLFPPAMDNPAQSTPVRLDRCSAIGESLLGFIITKRPAHGVQVTANQCTFDVKRAVQINAWPQFIGNLGIARIAQGTLEDCLTWQETGCTHAAGIEYLAARRVKANRGWTDGGLSGLTAWTAFWNGAQDSKTQVQSATEKRITSQLPAHDANISWDSDWGVHSYQPDN